MSQTVTDIVGNQVPFGAIDFSSVVPLVKDGRLRVLAQTGEARMPQLPEVPTMKESGYPELVSHVWSSIIVRSETPDAIVDRLHEAFKAAWMSPEGRNFQAARPSVEALHDAQGNAGLRRLRARALQESRAGRRHLAAMKCAR